MDFKKLDALKGFMPSHEGLALTKWAKEFSQHGPALEIGTFGAKSALYIAAGISANDQLIYTIDHHFGSEEHQLGEEYFDSDIYDNHLGRVNTVPLMQTNLQQFNENIYWPEETPSWTSAACILAADANNRLTKAHHLFTKKQFESL